MTVQKKTRLHIGNSFFQKDAKSCPLPARMCANTSFFFLSPGSETTNKSYPDWSIKYLPFMGEHFEALGYNVIKSQYTLSPLG